LLKTLSWHGIARAMHHKGMCAKNNTHMFVVQTSNDRLTFSGGFLLLFAATVRSFACMLLRLSNHNRFI